MRVNAFNNKKITKQNVNKSYSITLIYNIYIIILPKN